MLTYKKLFYIYEIVNDVTQKKYIGMTSRPSVRYIGHLSALRTGKHTGEGIVADYIKYGAKSFHYSILDTATTREEAAKKEEIYMRRYNTYVPEFGYNGKDPHFKTKYYNLPKCSDTELAQRINSMGYKLKDVAHYLGISCRMFANRVNHPEMFSEEDWEKIEEILSTHKYGKTPRR